MARIGAIIGWSGAIFAVGVASWVGYRHYYPAQTPVATPPPSGTTASGSPAPTTSTKSSSTPAVGANWAYHVKVQSFAPYNTLSGIASQLGIPYTTLAAANNIHAPWTIYVGQELRSPKPLTESMPVSSGTGTTSAQNPTNTTENSGSGLSGVTILDANGNPVIFSPCNSTYSEGDTGPCVALLQIMLNVTTNAGLTIDGDFGPLTQTAVETFQSLHFLATDGIVGSTTQAALNSAFAAATGSGGSTTSLLQTLYQYDQQYGTLNAFGQTSAVYFP